MHAWYFVYVRLSVCLCVHSRTKLHHNAAALHLPIGLSDSHKGIVDVIRNRAIYFRGEQG